MTNDDIEHLKRILAENAPSYAIQGPDDCDLMAEAAIEAMQQWQPIETAPKDGTVILLRGGVYHGLPFAGQYHKSQLRPDRPWVRLTGEASHLYEHVPTEWMPIPETSE